MRAVDLDWMPTEKAGKSRELRYGDELFYATFGVHSRFYIAEHHTRPERHGDCVKNLYAVRDADRVTDAQVRAGQRSPIVFRSADAQECIDWALNQ